MKKLLALVGLISIMGLLNSLGASAGTNQDLYADAVFLWNPSYNATGENSSNFNQGSEDGSVFNDTLCHIPGSGCGLFNSSQNNRVNFNSDFDGAERFVHPHKNKSLTMTAWVRQFGNAANPAVITSKQEDDSKDGAEIVIISADDVQGKMGFDDEDHQYATAQLTLYRNIWSFMMLEWNTSSGCLTLSLNISAAVSQDCSASSSAVTASNTLWLGSNGGSTYMDALVQAAYVFNRTLTDEEKDYLFNSGSGNLVTSAEEAAPVVNLTLNFPVTANLYNNDPLDINYSVSSTNAIDNTTIYVNGTLNKTVSGVLNTSIAIGEGTFLIEVNSTDNTGIVGGASAEVKVDRTTPSDDLLAVIPSGTEIYRDINYTITAADDNLFAHNVSVYDSGGNLLFSQEDLNITSDTNGIIIPINVTSYGVGTFMVFSNESDDHTAGRIRDYQITKDLSNNQLTFNSGKAEVSIKLNKITGVRGAERDNLNDLASMNAVKQRDRYNFGFVVQDSSYDSYEVELRIFTDKEIYQRDSAYSGHLVIGNEHWLDFEPYSVSVEQIGRKQYKVLLTSGSSNIWFNSIGGVNVGGSVSSFEIIPPNIVSIECQSTGWEDCTSLSFSDTILWVRVDCENGTSALASMTENGTSVFASQAASKSGDVYTYNNADKLLSSGSYNLSFICSNDAASAYSASIWTIAAPTPLSLANFPYNTMVAFLVTVLIIIFIGGMIMGKIGKFSGGRK